MAHETEAACLLRTGNLFLRRAGLRAPDGALTFVGVKPGAFALYLGDEPYYHFDLEGRWQRAFVGGTHVRKALDGSVDAIDRVREGPNLVLRRRALSFTETADLDAAIRAMAQGLAGDLDAGRLVTLPPPGDGAVLAADELRDLLDRIARWDAAAWFSQRAAHFEAYGPIGLLPPDAHNTVVLQATIGDADGHPFGGSMPLAHAIRDPEAFEDHVRIVTTFFGRRLAQCRGIFLGGRDVLKLPLDHVVALFEAIGRRLPIEPGAGTARPKPAREDEVRLVGIDTLLVDFTPPLPDRDGWARLKALGLGRVNLGLESGDPEVRSLYGRAWTDDQLAALVADLKAESVPVGLLLLVGAGGVEHADRHVAATGNLCDALPLDRNDLVYLIDANEIGDASLGGRLQALDPAATEAQTAALKERLAALRTRTGAKVVPYNPEKQWN